eukprot:1153748-Pelagomonas_calceolata.AAC.6
MAAREKRRKLHLYEAQALSLSCSAYKSFPARVLCPSDPCLVTIAVNVRGRSHGMTCNDGKRPEAAQAVKVAGTGKREEKRQVEVKRDGRHRD